MKKILLLLLLTTGILHGKTMDNTILNTLITDASKVYPDNVIMQQVTVTQAILESGFQTDKPSKLASQYYNLFGIKGKGSVGTVKLPTKEYINGQNITVRASFAVNASYTDSFAQHKDLLDRPRYKQVVEAKNPPEAFQALSLAGYATDPNYSELLEGIWAKYVKGRY